MKALGLGEFGSVTHRPISNGYEGYLRFRDYSGRYRRVKRVGKTKKEATQRAMAAVEVALRTEGVTEFASRSTFESAVRGWLVTFQSMVERGVRSPSTYDEYVYVAERTVIPGVGALRLGEISTPRLDRFVQSVLIEKGYATAKLCRTVLSGVCGWLVRQGVLPANPVRDLTRLELDRDRTARALNEVQVQEWLALLDADEYARRHDLPELARFMLATGIRLGEALGVTWADLDLTDGVVEIRRTIVRVKGQGLVAKGVKSRASVRRLVLPGWGVDLLRARRVRLGLFDGPVFPDSQGGWRDRSNVGKAFRRVRGGTEFDWVKTHTYRKTVATMLDEGGASARMIADQLGHARVSMTQDVYLGRRATNAGNAALLQSRGPGREEA